MPVANGVYHVVARGNAKREIFIDDADRSGFLGVLRDVLSRFGWRCLTYCLMGNHYHLVFRTPRPDLSRGMRQLNGVYAQRFNRRHGSCGHLFQGRFGAVLIQEDAHLLEVARYIVLNPVRASLCKRPEQWPWSGHHALIGAATDQVVARWDLLAYFSPNPAEARRRYRAFVADGTDSAPAESDLVAAASAHLPAEPPSREIARRPWLATRPSLAQLLHSEDRDAAIATAYRTHGYRMCEIAAVLGCHYATVSRRLRAFEQRRAGKTGQP